ncbi:MAG: DUF1549 domain-containing protein, partial [Candidatus Omnitrophica bacterium]|nr:DUF1549 domain-containing protein [Candidatus Omnitrophota bacterium]
MPKRRAAVLEEELVMAMRFRLRGGIAGLSCACLIFLWYCPQSWADEQNKGELSLSQSQALETLIKSLQTLKATPESATEIARLVQSGSDKVARDLKDAETRIESLKKQVAEAEAKKAALHTRLNALLAAQALLSGVKPGGAQAPSPDTPPSPSPPAASPAGEANTAPTTSEKAVESPAPPAAPATPEGEKGLALFREKVYPALERSCISCHGPEKQKSGLRVDSLEALLKEGEYGVPLTPGDPEKSFLIKAIRYDGDVKMPPKEKLPQEDIDAIIEWVKLGAPWPSTQTSEAGSTQPERVALKEIPWSFQPIVKPDWEGLAASLKQREWGTSPIDAFILKALEEKGLSPSPEADRRTLIRRLHLDVWGLPPRPEEVEGFVANEDPLAYERLVDALLASPRYGERWARHWLDVVRFGETNGFETNTPRRNAWPYRDYVIESFNQDKPYDRFIFEQLAGDALGEDRATGYLVGGPMDEVKSPDIGLTLQQRMNELDDMIATTCTAFLGLTVACARCHDHKFDPITMKDYYGLQAIFAGVQHGERELRPPDAEERIRKAEALRRELEPLLARLALLEPLAVPGIVFLDDTRREVASEDAPVVTLLRAEGVAEGVYAPGADRGRYDDPGGP